MEDLMKKLLVLLFLPGIISAAYIPGPIEVNNSAGTPTDVGYASGGSSVPVNVLNTVTVSGTITANGTVAVSNFPATYTVTPGSGTFPVSGTFWQATQPVSGTVGVNNFPATYTVTPGSGTWPISGTVTSTPGPISVWDVNQSTVTVGHSVNSSSVPVKVLNFPATYTVTPGSGTWPISGSVTSTPGPLSIWDVNESTKTVGYSSNSSSIPVKVLNLPSTYTVTPGSGTFPISGTVTATQSTPASLQVSAFINGSSNTVSAAQSGTWTNTVTQGTAANLQASVSINGSSNTVAATQSGTWNVGTVSTISGTVNVSTSNVKISDGTDTALVTAGGLLQVDASGVAVPVTDNSGSLTVDGTVTANQGGTWNIGTLTTVTNPVSVKIDGSSNTVQLTGTPSVNLSQVGGTSVVTGGVNGTQGVGGVAASSATNTGNPIKFGVVASTDIPTPTTHGKIMDAYGAKDGALIANLDCPRELIVKSTMTLTSSTAETVFLSSAATNVYHDALMIWALNTSATATRIDFRSGGGPTGGTIDFALYLPAGDQRGFSSPHRWPQTTAAANWTAQSSVSVSDVRVYGIFCKTK